MAEVFLLPAAIKLAFFAGKCSKGVIHLVRKHKGGGGSSKSVRHLYKGGGGLTHGSTYAKTSLFARVL